ncbi:MAG: hypothetical protein AAGC92_10460 [Pseudomonadota bacterium]
MAIKAFGLSSLKNVSNAEAGTDANNSPIDFVSGCFEVELSCAPLALRVALFKSNLKINHCLQGALMKTDYL